jgi:hypothetical protein
LADAVSCRLFALGAYPIWGKPFPTIALARGFWGGVEIELTPDGDHPALAVLTEILGVFGSGKGANAHRPASCLMPHAFPVSGQLHK